MMTDLDKLVDEIVEIATDESHHIFDLTTGSKLREAVRSALEDAAKQAYHSGFDSGRERGRIDGLKEAAQVVENADWPCDCAGGYKERGMVSPHCIAHEWMPDAVDEIRARIQELEGEK